MKDYSNTPTKVLIRLAVKRGMEREKAENSSRDRIIAFLKKRD
jgi:hypothetical protein